MAKVILICGKLCSGKSVYTERIKKEENAVVFSCDELMLSLFDEYLGDKHDEISANVQAYLYKKAVETVRAGANVILDWGYWIRARRQEACRLFEENGVEYEWHYIDVSEETWKRNIEKRNAAYHDGAKGVYYVDEGLLEKLQSLFEEPERGEMDVWYVNEW